MEIKNAKKVAVMNAVDFVKKASDGVRDALTRELQSVLKQFIEFKNHTWYTIDHMKDCEKRMIYSEGVAAQSWPVYEYRFQLDADYLNPVGKWDCLRPMLTEHWAIHPV